VVRARAAWSTKLRVLGGSWRALGTAICTASGGGSNSGSRRTSVLEVGRARDQDAPHLTDLVHFPTSVGRLRRGGAIEPARAGAFLDHGQRARHRGWRAPQLAPGRREAALLDDGDEDRERVEPIHDCSATRNTDLRSARL
jgi:hypothetical protein